jgi:hypothetical protein
MAAKKAVAARIPTRAEPEVEEVSHRLPPQGPPDDGILRNRLGEPIALARLADPADDKFSLKRMGIVAPQGWTYEWKTKTIKGADWTEHQVELAATGWTPVPASRHDGKCMPKGFEGNIERAGLLLMERPIGATRIARQVEENAARSQLNLSRQMAGMMAPSAIIDQSHPEAQRATGFRVHKEGTVVNPARNYQYVVDDPAAGQQ